MPHLASGFDRSTIHDEDACGGKGRVTDVFLFMQIVVTVAAVPTLLAIFKEAMTNQ